MHIHLALDNVTGHFQETNLGLDLENLKDFLVICLTMYSSSDLVDKVRTVEFYPSLLGDKTLIYRTYIRFLTYSSGEWGFILYF